MNGAGADSAGEPVSSDIQGSPVDENDEFDRFETLARKVVNTPKKSAPPEPARETIGEPADGGAERERQG